MADVVGLRNVQRTCCCSNISGWHKTGAPWKQTYLNAACQRCGGERVHRRKNPICMSCSTVRDWLPVLSVPLHAYSGFNDTAPVSTTSCSPNASAGIALQKNMYTAGAKILHGMTAASQF